MNAVLAKRMTDELNELKEQYEFGVITEQEYLDKCQDVEANYDASNDDYANEMRIGYGAMA